METFSETSRTDGDWSLTTETFRAARLLLPNSAGSAIGPQSNSYLFQRSPNITSTVREFVHRKEKPINYYLQRTHMCVYFFLNISCTRHQLRYILKTVDCVRCRKVTVRSCWLVIQLSYRNAIDLHWGIN